jgi:hypothetical protein
MVGKQCLLIVVDRRSGGAEVKSKMSFYVKMIVFDSTSGVIWKDRDYTTDVALGTPLTRVRLGLLKRFFLQFEITVPYGSMTHAVD